MMLTSVMIATFYWCSSAPGEGGIWTAQGRRCDPRALAAAHRTLPFGTVLNVCLGGRCIGVVINDRGPFIRGRDLDLTVGAARQLGMFHRGVARVRVAVPMPREKPYALELMAKGQTP
jgi:rare lipoprotein A